MKKIINGKKYDTESAKCLASWSNGQYGNFSYCQEELYRKKTGEFFLYGEGGPMSRYAKSCGQNEWTSGEEIIPLSYSSAQGWAEEKLDGDEFEEIFGEIVEDGDRTTATYSLANATIERLRREAARTGKGVGELIDELVAKGLA